MSRSIGRTQFGIRFCVAAIVLVATLAWAAQPAGAVTRQVTGGETRLEVNLSNFVVMLNDGIFITAIAPAHLEYGASPAAFLPVRPPGAVDTENTLAAVPHDGGLRLAKDSIGMTVDTTNITIQCTSLTSCRLLATANQALPNEVAEIANPQLTDDEVGTVTITGTAQLSQLTATTLNTLFQTSIFYAGFQLGFVRSTLHYTVPTTPGAYVRPKGASPLRASLVPAYKQCSAPNNTHGAPLANASCSPPQASSPNVTVGTPDANGAGAGSVANVVYRVRNDNTGTPADEADIRIDANATDVRKRSDLSDYAGELQAVVGVQITDGANSLLPPVFPANETGTVQLTPLSVTVPCLGTAAPTIGSNCAVSTSADAVAPGVVMGGLRSVWEFDRVDLMDGGPDGDAETPDNSLFATQGVFVP